MAKKQKPDCRADTRGGPWVGIPKCLVDSAAYRSLSAHARSILIEIMKHMNGYNNGKIAVSHRDLRNAIGCRPQRITDGVVELMDHGMIDVTVEGQWKTRQARQYRLTFVSTLRKAATNEYLHWTGQDKQSGVTDAVTGTGESATDAVTVERKAVTDAVTTKIREWRKSAKSDGGLPATDAVTLICKPYPSASKKHSMPGLAGEPGKTSSLLQNCCERCSTSFARVGRGGTQKRFCSERCRKSAEHTRARQRSKQGAVKGARS